MQIVIDVPEEIKSRFDDEYCNEGEISKCTTDAILEAFCNGTQLPKGHGELVDVSKIIHTTVYNDQYEECEDEEMTILDFVNAYTDEGITEAIIEADKR